LDEQPAAKTRHPARREAAIADRFIEWFSFLFLTKLNPLLYLV
jgi:hypothetical protein